MPQDAPKFNLSARTSEDEDVLLVAPDDLNPPSEKKKAVANPVLDAKLFNALVSPVAPVHLTASSASPTSEKSAGGQHEPENPAAPNFSPSADQSEQISPSARKFWDPAAIDDERLAAQFVPDLHANEDDDTPTLEDAGINVSGENEAIFSGNQTFSGGDSETELDSDTGLEDLSPAFSMIGTMETPVPAGRTGAWWTLPLMCAGIAISACAILVPATDENRRAMHELAKIEQDVSYFEKQSEVNKQFLEHVSTDPTLAERLALRQLRLTRASSKVVRMPQQEEAFGMSPFALVSIDPPVPIPAYRPLGGTISTYFLDTKGQIYLAGLGILLTAAGVILGGGSPDKA